jgi:hypothetical protein
LRYCHSQSDRHPSIDDEGDHTPISDHHHSLPNNRVCTQTHRITSTVPSPNSHTPRRPRSRKVGLEQAHITQARAGHTTGGRMPGVACVLRRAQHTRLPIACAQPFACHPPCCTPSPIAVRHVTPMAWWQGSCSPLTRSGRRAVCMYALRAATQGR